MTSNSKMQVVGLALSVIMLLTLLNSGYFFLAMLKLSIGKWLAFNACSLATIAYLLCFVLYKTTKRDYILAIPLLPLYYYGTMGMFVMPWNEANLFPQITHIIITLNVLWIVYVLLKEHKFEALGKGSLLGMIIFVPIFACIQGYTQQHMGEFMAVLQAL
ncbi:hypothetical protein [Acetobacteroides hydrogenigenes]|nr:hypothetical protein [Acetobacteroides hydrogenigenes]